MSAVLDFFRGTSELRLTGACPEDALTRLSEQRIAFRPLARGDDFTYLIRVLRRDEARAEACIRRALCDVETVRRAGLAQVLRGVRCRVYLTVCSALLLAALCILPQFIWTLEVQGCETLHPQQVLRALESIGVSFGTWGPGVDIQAVKNHMLALLPELEWIAVNRSGGRAIVLVHERIQKPAVSARREAVNIVAARTGIVTRMEVYNGDALIEPGQTVLRGEVLVTGCLARTNGIHFTHAMAEIYARTWHEVTAVTPASVQQKRYTGQSITRYAIILGKHRINFYTNSGISGATCDKMTQTIPLTLPGGVTLPLALVEVTCRAYETTACSVPASDARDTLDSAATRCVSAQLVGGSITAYRSEFHRDGALCRLTAVAECSEQIALEQAAAPGKDAAND